jgi:cytochrome b561
MSDPRYPFFHWATGLVVCAALVVGLLVGFAIGLAL